VGDELIARVLVGFARGWPRRCGDVWHVVGGVPVRWGVVCRGGGAYGWVLRCRWRCSRPSRSRLSWWATSCVNGQWDVPSGGQ